MDAQSKHSLNNAFDKGKQWAKDKENQRFAAQMKRVYSSFTKQPKTMKQVSVETNVMRSNICRYIAKWRKVDKIGVARYGRCPITKNRRVGFYTTNPDLFLIHKHKK